MLKWFLLIIQRTLNRYTNLFKLSHIAFLIKRRLADAQYWTATLSTEKRSHQRFPIKTLFLKVLQYSQENICVKFLRKPILKNICVLLLLFWTDFKFHHERLLHKKKTLLVLGLLVKRCNNILFVIWLDRKYWRWNYAMATLEPLN